MTCPSCGCDISGDGDNPQELECGICNWSGHPTECFTAQQDDDERRTHLTHHPATMMWYCGECGHAQETSWNALPGKCPKCNADSWTNLPPKDCRQCGDTYQADD